MPVVTQVGVADAEARTFIRADLISSVVDISGSSRNKANAKIILVTGQEFEVLEDAEDVFNALEDVFDVEFVEQDPQPTAEEKAAEFEADRLANATVAARTPASSP